MVYKIFRENVKILEINKANNRCDSIRIKIQNLAWPPKTVVKSGKNSSFFVLWKQYLFIKVLFYDLVLLRINYKWSWVRWLIYILFVLGLVAQFLQRENGEVFKNFEVTFSALWRKKKFTTLLLFSLIKCKPNHRMEKWFYCFSDFTWIQLRQILRLKICHFD